MEIEVKEANGVTIVCFTGSLDTVTSAEVDQKLNELIGNGALKLVLNFEKLNFISSAGLQTLLGITKRLAREGGEFRVTNINETVMEVFTISGFNTILKICPAEAVALAELA
jgi:anti-anti-sigma factor